jgi:enoyl-CoA hydratase/carnithine racemase
VTDYDLGTSCVELAVEDNIAIVALNRPDRYNALNAELLRGLATAWEIVRDEDSVRVAVLTGRGKAFCAGADINQYLTSHKELRELLNPALGLRPDRGLAMHKPVIAAVNGHCLGGGLTLLLATDIRFAVPAARFGTPEVGWGVLATCGGTQRLIRQVPHAVAMRMLLSGQHLTASEAAGWGLVNEVVEPASLLDAALECARTIASKAPLAVQATKELALAAHDLPAASGLRMEDLMARLLQYTEDAAEGTRAWAEKRPPSYFGS